MLEIEGRMERFGVRNFDIGLFVFEFVVRWNMSCLWMFMIINLGYKENYNVWEVFIGINNIMCK